MAVPDRLRRFGKRLDRLTDNWFVDLILGNWFDRPVNNWLDRRNQPTPPPRRRRYLDADGNEIPPPNAESL